MGAGAWTARALAILAADGLGLELEPLGQIRTSDLRTPGIAGAQLTPPPSWQWPSTLRDPRPSPTRGNGHNQSAFAVFRRRPTPGVVGARAACSVSSRTMKREARAMRCPEILGRAGLGEIEGPRQWRRLPCGAVHYGLQRMERCFAEVKGRSDFGQSASTRLVGAFAPRRIINPRLVRSQLFGAYLGHVHFVARASRPSTAAPAGRSTLTLGGGGAEYPHPGDADVPA